MKWKRFAIGIYSSRIFNLSTGTYDEYRICHSGKGWKVLKHSQPGKNVHLATFGMLSAAKRWVQRYAEDAPL